MTSPWSTQTSIYIGFSFTEKPRSVENHLYATRVLHKNRERLNTTRNNLLTKTSSRIIFLHNREHVCKKRGHINRSEEQNIYRAGNTTTGKHFPQQQKKKLSTTVETVTWVRLVWRDIGQTRVIGNSSEVKKKLGGMETLGRRACFHAGTLHITEHSRKYIYKQ